MSVVTSLQRCYELLDITSDSTAEEIKQTYKDLVNVWHPDRFAHSPRLQKKALRKLKEINVAYEILKDPGQTIPGPATIRAPYLEKRKYPRTSCMIPVNHATTYRVCSPLSDTIQDISGSGIFISTRETLYAGEKVRLTFRLPGFGELINIAGVVTRTCPSGIGVQFNVSDRFQKFISGFVSRQPDDSPS